jgi:hypothetical protein
MSETQPETTEGIATPESTHCHPAAPESADAHASSMPGDTPPENAVSGSKLDDVMRQCGNADIIAIATGTEAQVCADIAERQRKGVKKYGTTVADNPLPIVGWLTHAYEEVLDLAIYLRKTIDDINEKRNYHHGHADGVQPAGHRALRRTRKPGSGRKAIPCPNCGAEKSIGMTTLNKIPTRRCKACGHVVKQYPNLAKAATP